MFRNGYKLDLKLEQQRKKPLFDRFEGHPNLIAPGVTDEELMHTLRRMRMSLNKNTSTIYYPQHPS